jgi:hypothetical protein
MWQVIIGSDNRSNNVKYGSLSVSLVARGQQSCNVTIFGKSGVFSVDEGKELTVIDGINIIFAGVIKSVSTTLITPLGEEAFVEYGIYSDGFNSIPARRTVDAFYTNTTAGAIVTDMLGVNLLAQEGVVAGTIDAGATIPRYSVSFYSIKQILDDMAKTSGYMWYIDKDKRLHFKQSDPIVDAPFEIVTDGAFTDFHDVQVSSDFENYANKIFVIGGVDDQNVLQKASVQDPAEIAARQALENNSGVYGYVVEDRDALDQATVTAIAQNELKKRSMKPLKLSFNSYNVEWRPSAKLKVNVPEIGIASDTFFLIEEVSFRREGEIVVASISATKRDEDDFNTQKSSGFVEYFEELVKDKSTLGIDGGGSGTTGLTAYIRDQNTAIKTINTTLSAVTSLTFALESRSSLLVHFSATVETSAAMLLTAQIYNNGNAVGYEAKQNVSAAGFQLVTFIYLIEDVLASNRTIEVRMQTSTGTGTIAIQQAQMVIEVTGYSGSSIDLQPEITVTNDATIFNATQTTSGETEAGTAVDGGNVVNAVDTFNVTQAVNAEIEED